MTVEPSFIDAVADAHFLGVLVLLLVIVGIAVHLRREPSPRWWLKGASDAEARKPVTPSAVRPEGPSVRLAQSGSGGSVRPLHRMSPIVRRGTPDPIGRSERPAHVVRHSGRPGGNTALAETAQARVDTDAGYGRSTCLVFPKEPRA